MVYSTFIIKIEKTNVGYYLYFDDWFVGGFKTISALQDKVTEIINARIQ